MDELKRWYLDKLPTRIEALEAAKRALEEGQEEAMDAIRRIAHSLYGSGTTYGFPEITDAAERLKEAEGDNLGPCLENLLDVLQKKVSELDSGGKTGILIIEDDPEMHHFLKVKLSSENRRIFIAENVVQAEEILIKNRISLILLDLILPDADGRNYLVQLRERPVTAGIPVIILTAKGGDLTRKECLALGADEFLIKPLEAAAIITAVDTKLRQVSTIKEELRHDQLTGLSNRADFCDLYHREVSNSFKNKEPITLSIIDLDNLKSINEKYGRVAGDEVIRVTASIISKSIPSPNMIARIQNGEFAILFRNSKQSKAKQLVENALDELEKQSFQMLSATRVMSVSISEVGTTFTLLPSFGVTFSAGVKEIEEESPLDTVMEGAKHLLFLAKTNGRARVVSPEDGIVPKKLKILLADDDELVASIINHRLKRENFDVMHFTDGAEAFSAAQEAEMSLAILDVKMPGMDGFELLKRMREIPGLKQTPIVMLTSLGNERDVARGLELGADDYIVKPFSPYELMARIHRLLKKGRERHEDSIGR